MIFPTWVWLYFGTLGTIGAVLFTLTVWYWMKTYAISKGIQRSAVKWNMIGLLFLFLGAWFACGIGGSPGNLLSKNIAAHDLEAAYDSAILSIFFSAPGWASILIGQRRMLQSISQIIHYQEPT